MKKVFIALLAFLCFSVFAFANVNATPDEDWAEKMANRALLMPAPAKVMVASGVPLVGDYYIPKGANPMGFDSLSIAVDSLNANGAGGMINFILDADTLRDKSFTFTADLNADSCVTVKPAAGRDVVLIVTPGASRGNGIQMIGFDKGYVTFDGSNDGSDSRNLLVTTETNDTRVPFGLNTADADNITLKNLIIRNIDGVTTGFRYGAVQNDVAGIENWVVDNCQICSEDFPAWRDGIAVWGSGAGPSNGIITNNDIYAAARGIATYVVNDCVFNGNNITMLPTSGAGLYTYNYVHGIYVTGASGPTEIKGNTISFPEAATKASSYLMGVAFAGNSEDASDPINIENNMIDMGHASETYPTYGIGLRSANPMGNLKVYHNTIVMNQTSCTDPVYAIGNHSNGTGPVDIVAKNNILVNKHTGNAGSAAIGLIPSTSVLESDNNIIASASIAVNFKGTTYAALADWQAVQDANSDSVEVTFAAADDLHLAAPSDEDVNLVMPTVGIVEDIDGDDRGIYLAYAGADEGTAYPNNDLDLTFDTDADVTNWSHHDEANGWTVEAHENSALRLSDAGFSMIAKRPIKATDGSLYKLSVDIKTVAWAGAPTPLALTVQGLGNDDVAVEIVSEGVWTTFTLMGIADGEDGYIRIYGSNVSGQDTVWVDNVMWDDQYMDVVPSESIADVKLVPNYEWAACVGVVTNVSTGAPIFMEDATAGISLYDWDFINDGIVEEGDEILIYGKRSTYKGLVQIQNTDDNYQVLSKDNAIEPTLITVADLDSRDYQGMLVKLNDIDTTNGFSWPTEGNDASITLTDGVNEFTMRIDRDSEVDGSEAPESWPIDLIGVISEYDTPQVMPRFRSDIITNQAPGAFAWINPVDGDTVSSMDDPALVDVVVAPGDTAKALFANWTESADEDSVVYEWVFIGEGPDDVPTTTDTFMVIPLNMDAPFEMNGTYNIAIKATDPMGKETMSDTIEFTFDFPAPPMVVNADVVLVDGAPQYYVEFDMDVTAEVADFKVLKGATATAATAVAPVGGNAVMVTVPLTEDEEVALIVDGVTPVGGTLSEADTTETVKVLIPFSDAHPEDAAMLMEGFEGATFNFKTPGYSGSTSGIVKDNSTLAASDEEAYEGSKSGKITIVDDPAVEGGWFIRMPYVYPYAQTVKTTSTLILMVKGTGNVDLALTITENPGYERMIWKSVSLCANDWQVVSFDLANDEAEGWVNGNGTVEGTTVMVGDLHMKSDVDEDVVLYIDGFTERQVLSPVDITFNVNMKEWLRRDNFNPVSNYVDIAGTMNGWGATSTLLSDFDGDTTYSVTIPLMPFSTQSFKFRIDGSWDAGKSEFPNGAPNRDLTIPAAAAEYTYWFNNDTLVVSTVGIPAEFALHQNYPNPFNPTTMIEFDLPEVADVSLVIYDLTGRQIRTLVNGSINAGYRGITWNGCDDFGNGVATGMYIYRLKAGNFVDVKKMTFMK